MKYIEVIEKEQGVKEVWLNRPDLHNAFNAVSDSVNSLFVVTDWILFLPYQHI